MPEIPFCGQTYAERTPNANAQNCINMYPVRSPTAENPNRIILYPTPGYSLLKDTLTLGIAGTGAIRGFFEINGVLYMVSGNQFLRATMTGGVVSYTSLGTIGTYTGRCSLISNTVEILIGDGAAGYVYNLTTGVFGAISGGSFPASGGVTNFTYHDGYALASPNNSKRIIQSDLLAGGTYGAQAFAQVTSFADNIVSVFSDQLQVYIFGPKVTEVRFNASAIPFAFEKVQGVLIQAGCAAAQTIVKVGTSVIWLAADIAGKAYVAALEGYNPKVLSTPPINEAFERYSSADIAAAFAYSYRESDNQFYVITFPTATWAYDLKLGQWHQRSVAGSRDLPDQCVTWQGRHLVGDASGKLWWMGQEYLTDQNGDGLTRQRTCQNIKAEDKTFFLDELYVDVMGGVGTISGQGVVPLATLEISKDGGHTWINVGTAMLGAMGHYKTRLTWRRLGRIRNSVAFRLTMTDPVEFYILGAYAKIRPGTK